MARLSFRFPALCAALLLGALIPAPFGAAQEAGLPASDSKIGTREQKARDVDWAELRREEAARGRMDPRTGVLLETPAVAAASHQELAKARLPVLLPGDESLAAQMQVFAEPGYYTASMRGETYSVQITGTRIAQGKLEARRAARRMRAMTDEQGYIYQQTEYGCELSFTRYNVSYNISVECLEPEADPRCRGKEYIMELARSLVYVGGTPE